MGRLPAVRRSRLPHHCVACGAELQPPHRRLRCSNCLDGPRLAAHTTPASATSLDPEHRELATVSLLDALDYLS